MPFFLYVLATHSEVQINEGLDWGECLCVCVWGGGGGAEGGVTKNRLSLKSNQFN